MFKNLNLLVILLLFATGCSSSDDSGSKKEEVIETPTDPQDPEEELTKVKVVAHRGAWKEFELPDNSIAALEKAIEIGSDVSECDIQLTKDLQIVVYHDEKVAGKYLKDLTYAELSSQTLSNGEQIPLLTDFLDIVISADFELWLDIKSLSDLAGGDAWSIKVGEEAAKIIRDKKAQKNVAYIVGRKAVLDKCILSIRGEWEAAYMNTEYTPEQFVNQGLTWANFSYSKFYENPTALKDYLNKDIKVSVYTIDDDSVMDWFLAQEGVYAISTNYPEKLLAK